MAGWRSITRLVAFEKLHRCASHKGSRRSTESGVGEVDHELAVVGLGYVGLPLVREASKVGLSTVGFDISSRVVDGLNAGRSHVDDISEDDVRAMLDAGFTASVDGAVLATANTVVICVPTPLDARGGPDLGPVRSAATIIAQNLRAGQLVSLESTSYPGTTLELVVPILETSGLKAGVDFHVGFSPERVDPGNKNFNTKNTPKIVSGIDEESAARMEAFYSQVVGTVVRASGTREAEAAKLLENTYRHINIALVNELARVFHELDIDIWEVIRLAATKPFGFQAFYPGPGVGGHCIPIDPNYLNFHASERLGYPVRLVALAEEINSGMPAYVVQRTQDLLNAGLDRHEGFDRPSARGHVQAEHRRHAGVSNTPHRGSVPGCGGDDPLSRSVHRDVDGRRRGAFVRRRSRSGRSGGRRHRLGSEPPTVRRRRPRGARPAFPGHPRGGVSGSGGPAIDPAVMSR